VRGAIEISVNRDRRYQLSILGPGRLCGAGAMIAESVGNSDARIRSDALLLAFDPPAFGDLYLGETTDCLKFQNMVSANQLEELKTADNLLTTLVSQDRILEGARSRGL
jgi:CRP-like cAMP-binding protein